MAPPLLTLQNIHLTFGSTPLLEGAEFFLLPGDKICLVGRNGSGKSTLLKIAAGLIDADDGQRFVQPGVTMRYLPQEPDFSGFSTIRAYIEAGLAPGDDIYQVDLMLDRFGLKGDEDPSRLSGGEGKKASIARAFAPEPDILLLDEPTNHLDLPTIEWLEGELISSKSAIVLISHDKRLLEHVSGKTVWIDRGKSRTLERGFSHFEAWRDDIFEHEERESKKLSQRIAMEEDWLRYGVTARRKRNVKRLANLHSMRNQRKTARKRDGQVQMSASQADPSAKLIVEAKSASKSYDKPIVTDFSIRVKRGDRIGIVGPNGAGKSTLVAMMTGALKPDEGHIRVGKNLEMVSLDQRREALKDRATLADALTGGSSFMVEVGDVTKHVAGYMKDFLFKPEQMNTPIHVLSGGERGRVMLARALARKSNFLVLDEPTNDLDLETLDLLQEMLSEYSGTILLVSHDRDFLDRIVTSVIATDGDGHWTEYAGGYRDMLAQKKASKAAFQGTEKPENSKSKDRKAAADSVKSNINRAVKLSYKQKYLLDTLPDTMDALSKEILAIEEKLADPHLFTKDPKAFQKLSSDLETKRSEVEAAETQWLELEMLREEIDNS